MQNFIDLSTFTDPLRTSNFPQNWTIYYWAYWMVWCVAAPFFIGSISRGRTVRQTILGGYVFGVGSTLTSFIVLGNYSMGLQMTDKADFIAKYLENGDMYGMIVDMIKTMPGAPVVMVAVLITMIAFYATSFDSIALTASCYSYHTLKDDEQPNKGIQLMWCILLILLPIALLFAESSMNNLQSVSIVAAFPIGAVIVMIAASFWSLLQPAIERAEAAGSMPAFLVATLGFLCGALFMWGSDKCVTYAQRRSALAQGEKNARLNRIILLVLSITLHNIPEGLAVAVPFAYAARSRAAGVLAALVSGLAEPLGAVLAWLFLRRFFTPGFLNGTVVLAAGIMVWVSFAQLLPDAFAPKHRAAGILGAAAGTLLMLLGIAALP